MHEITTSLSVSKRYKDQWNVNRKDEDHSGKRVNAPQREGIWLRETSRPAMAHRVRGLVHPNQFCVVGACWEDLPDELCTAARDN